MGSLGVCATTCNLHTQRLCYLNNGLRRYASSGRVTRSYTQHNLSLFNVHVRRLSTTLSTPANNVRFNTSLSDKRNVGPRQYTAKITTTASLHSESSQDSQNKPDDRPELDEAVSFVKDQQVKTPWQREGSETPPVRRERSASAMTKGKLLTTPSRLLKLVLPVTTEDYNGDRKDIEPLALLLHPQQPLSYLERLIQAEVPPIKDKKTGKIHPPHVEFLAIEAQDETIQPKRPKARNLIDEDKKDGQEGEDQDEQLVVTKSSQAPRLRNIPDEEDNSVQKNNNKPPQKDDLENETKTEEQIESESKRRGAFVRWSSSTEIGDFIRDAARVKEFLVEIENSPLGRIPVAVPSFNDRTYYLRMRLRKLSKNLKRLAIVKHECDILAHRGAQRVALGGLGVMVSWWYIVYKLTFETDYGWDTMEPITYLVSLSTLMGGYTWFLYHNREISYRSALDFTVNRRQQKLYQTRGIDLQVWESLIEEANSLRREIKTVAEEYDVDWDERADEEDERVTEALKHERRQKERREEKEKKREKEEGRSEESN